MFSKRLTWTLAAIIFVYAAEAFVLEGTLTTTTALPPVTEQSTTQGQCEDVFSTCYLLDPTYYCVGIYYNWAIDNCRKTCDLCNSAKTHTTLTPTTSTLPGAKTHTTLTPTTSTLPVCKYKGKQYLQDEVWTDGCTLNCTCEDASIGYYRCRDLCPKYINVPPGVNFIVKPGECCAEPDRNITLETYKKPLIYCGSYNDFCSYKGQTYTQDETWKDGCIQHCTCTNAYQHMHSCRSVCLDWPTLPYICHLEDPPAGLCCKQPRCPSEVLITIPLAYKDEYPGYTYM
ncbi:hypothetical protein ACF0H5_005942 [Mactra antiquata]